ncbi:MAG: hypothetical protein JW969_09635 [Spirochaetales bacterium]|nr:hypothetical protein [Spirochaetales bacterium]
METDTQNNKKPLLSKINLPAVFSNSIFIVGLLLLNWSTAFVLWGYWIDEIIGFIFLAVKYIILKASHKGEKTGAGGVLFAYAFFMFGHLVFLLIFFGIFAEADANAEMIFESVFYFIAGRFYSLEPEFLNSLFLVVPVSLLAAFVALFKDFLFKKKYRELDLAVFEKKAFTPIILPHLIIVFGGFCLVLLKAQAQFALVLVMAKLLAEFLIYRRDRSA